MTTTRLTIIIFECNVPKFGHSDSLAILHFVIIQDIFAITSLDDQNVPPDFFHFM